MGVALGWLLNVLAAMSSGLQPDVQRNHSVSD